MKHFYLAKRRFGGYIELTAMDPVQVLFVDDDDSLQLLASVILNGHQFKVFSAKNTKEAEVHLRQQKIDLIVCDVMMPEEDGISFCSRFKRGGCSIPMLILSAAGDPATIRKGLSSGANHYLVKPFDILELQKRMFAMVGRTPSGALKSNPSTSNHPKFLNWFRPAA